MRLTQRCCTSKVLYLTSSCQTRHCIDACPHARLANPLRQGLGLDGDQISPAVFPLPNLGETLRALATGLHTKPNRGFFILRGLDPSGLTPEDMVLRYIGIASFVADKIGVQDGHGNVLGKKDANPAIL